MPAIAGEPADAAGQPRTVADSGSQTGKKYTASALLHISVKTPHLVFPSTEREGLAEFETYKATQEQLVKSQHVLNAAIRNLKIRELPTLQREEERRRAIPWLTSQLRVSFPGRNSEVMMLGLTTPDPKEAAALVNAVVGAYMREVVNVERNQRVIRRSELDKVWAEKENELRKKKNDLKQIADQLGLADPDGDAVGRRLALEQALASEKELAGLRSDLRRTRGELEVQRSFGRTASVWKSKSESSEGCCMNARTSPRSSRGRPSNRARPRSTWI